MNDSGGRMILLYDGVCALCNGLVRFILERDRRGVISFAALQSPLAQRILDRREQEPGRIDTVILVREAGTPREGILQKSDAVLAILKELGGPWKAVAVIASLVPRPVRDIAYDAIASVRYRLFGKYETCPSPPERWRDRFPDA